MEVRANTYTAYAARSASPTPSQASAPKAEPQGDGFTRSTPAESKLSNFVETVETKAGPFSSVVAGAAIGAGITALATASGVGAIGVLAPAVLTAGAVGVGIGLYRSRNETGDYSSIARAGYAAFHGATGLAGGVVGKATMLGLASGGTATAIVAGTAAAVVAGGVVLYGIAKVAEELRPHF